jgi:uncharacterized iron-regulated membrane protein
MKGFLSNPRAVWWRGWLFQVHLWLALILGPVLTVVCLTGSFVVFRYELNRMTVDGTAYVTPQEKRLTLDELTKRVRQARPNDQLSSASWDAGKDTGFNFWTTTPEGHRLHTFVNPYTGEITGQEDYHDKWIQWFYELHANLLMGPTGMYLNGFVGLAAVVLSITGLVVWWPGLPRWRTGLQYLWGARWQRQNYDWHKLIGFYSSGAVMLIALTGMYFSFPALYKQVFSGVTGTKVDTTGPRAKTTMGPGSPTLEEFVRLAEEAQPGAKFVSLSFPKKAGDPVSVRTKEERDWHRIGLNHVYFEPGDGKLIRSARFDEASAASKAVLLMYPLHFGRFGGLWSPFWFYAVMVLYVVLGLAPPALMVTGSLMYWNRVLSKKWKKRKAGRVYAEPVASESL